MFPDLILGLMLTGFGVFFSIIVILIRKKDESFIRHAEPVKQRLVENVRQRRRLKGKREIWLSDMSGYISELSVGTEHYGLRDPGTGDLRSHAAQKVNHFLMPLFVVVSIGLIFAGFYNLLGAIR